MSSGIYKIECLTNGKIYIGLSTKVNDRMKFHRKRLNCGAHKNEHLQHAWNKYGDANFKFEIIEHCEEASLNEKEKYWISFYKCDKREFGFNKTAGGEFGKVSDEINQRRILKLKQQIIPQEQRRKISDALAGRKQSKELVEIRAKSNRICDEQTEISLAQEYVTSKITIKSLAKRHNLPFYAVRGALSRQGVCK